MTMKRANKRWLDGDCPAGVLAIFDNGGQSFDRYTILYTPTAGDDWVNYFAASEFPFAPQGFGQHGELRAHEVAPYRYAETSRRHSTKWSTLPGDVRRAVLADLA